MRELIRHILNESRLQQELKQFIEDNNIFDAVKMVGGIDNLKSILKNDSEFSKMLNELTGVVDFTIYDGFNDPEPIVFPLQYEIVGERKNRWHTNSWPEINLIYDDSKLTSSEKKRFMTILSVIQNDNTVGGIKSKLFKFGFSDYIDVTQINGKNVDIHNFDYPFSKEDVKIIHDKLYGGSESLNESHNPEIEKNLKAINTLLSLVSWDGLCEIWVDYNSDDDDYEIKSKTTRRHLDSDEIFRELSSLDDSIKSMGIKVYIYTPWYVDSCDEEVEFMNESLDEHWVPEEKNYSDIEKVINQLVPKKFPWFKEIEIDNISYSELSHTLTIYGELKVDEEWGAKQWREYYEYKPFPSNSGWEEEDPVRMGDIIGKNELDNLNDELELIVSSVGDYSTINTIRLGQLKLYFV